MTIKCECRAGECGEAVVSADYVPSGSFCLYCGLSESYYQSHSMEQHRGSEEEWAGICPICTGNLCSHETTYRI